MESQDIVREYTFSTEELEKLKDIHVGIVASKAALDGMEIYKNAILMRVYERLGIDPGPNKEYSKRITYNLTENVITYTRTPIKEEPKAEVAKK